MRRFDEVVAVAAKVIPADVVGDEENEVRASIGLAARDGQEDEGECG